MPEPVAGMICEECGEEMNRHAEKLVDPSTAEEAGRMDPELGGLIEEMFCCPGCGKGESRRIR